ncbi:MAG: hypothetical protein BGO10_04925 [Chlamydia sp. 32-24]|nr:MAG: hypothetical protein BGO10_04925 [Chlamydia sp. 32-24]
MSYNTTIVDPDQRPILYYNPQQVHGAFTYNPSQHQQTQVIASTDNNTAQVYQSRKISVGCHVLGIIGLSVVTVVNLAIAAFSAYLGWNAFLTGNLVTLGLCSALTAFSITIACSSIAKIVELAKEIHNHNKAKNDYLEAF